MNTKLITLLCIVAIVGLTYMRSANADDSSESESSESESESSEEVTSSVGNNPMDEDPAIGGTGRGDTGP